MEELETNIIIPNNYSDIADLPKDLQKMAQSIQAELNKKLEEKDLNDKLKPTLQQYENKIAEIEEVNKKQNQMIEDLLTELPDKELEGSNIEIKDSAKARARIIPLGNTEQESREGYNLLDVSKLEQGGMTGSTSAYGENISSNTRVRTEYIPVTPNTTYLVQAFDTNVLVKYVFEYDENKLGDAQKRPYIVSDVVKKIFTTSSTTYFIRIAFNKVGDATIVPSDVTKAQLVLGTEEKPYEKYGKTPTIEFPSPIKVVEGSYSNKIENKNLFSFDKAIVKSNSGVTATLGENKFTMVGTAGWGNYYVCFKNPKKNSDIAISADFLETILASKKGISIYGNNVDYISNLQAITTGYIELSSNVKTRIKTIGNTGDYEYIWFRFWNNGTGTALTKESNCIVDNIQLELGNTATDYVEHQEQTKNLNFPQGIQLAKEDELEFSYTIDEIGYKTIDRDSVYHIGNTGYIELNGTEDWLLSGTTVGYRYYLQDDINLYASSDPNVIPNISSNMFKPLTMGNTWGGKTGISAQFSETIGYSRLNLCYISNETNTVEKWKSWLAKNLPNVRYPLAIPITTQITDETFINQLEDLLNSETYKGVTHITTSKEISEVADLILKVDYKQSNSSRIDALEKAILSIGGNV